MLNLMTLERWTLIFGIGLALIYVTQAAVITYIPGGQITEIKEGILLWYSIIVFCILLICEIAFTTVFVLTKRKVKKSYDNFPE